ncbi:lipoprotein [Pseudomonas aeruginosa]|nr:lipoprotein [Pseudomonas aeruginosa]
MKKTVTLALLLAASLGLAACDKKEEDKAAAPAAPATETQPSAPATPLRAQRPGAVERHSGNPADSGTDSGATATEPAISSR